MQIASDPQNLSGDRDDEVMRALRDLPASRVEERKAAILEAGRDQLPRWTGEAAEFVEVLEAADCWDEAYVLAQAMVAGVPEDVEHAVQRSDVLALQAHVEAELALGSGDRAGVAAALSRWEEAETTRAQASAKRRPLFGLEELREVDG
jgi:hypothetical protein